MRTELGKVKKIPPYLCINAEKEGAFVFHEKARNITKTQTILVVEPHPDDGALSMGGYLFNRYLAGDRLISAVIFMQEGEIGKQRQSETEFVWKAVLEGDCHYLNLPDQDLNLTNGEGIRINRQAKDIVNQVCEYVSGLICEYSPDIVIFPMGIGEHPHHTIANMCFRLIYSTHTACQYMFYEDFPYSDLSRIAYIRPVYRICRQFRIIKEYHCISETILDKVNLIMAYQSQHTKTFDEVKGTLSDYGEAILYEGIVEGNPLPKKGLYERLWKMKRGDG